VPPPANAAPTVRVVFADVPLMVRELVADALSAHARLEILQDARLGFDLAFADLQNAELSPSGLILLEMAARPKVLGLHDGRECVLYELRPHRAELGELSDAVLTQVLASAIGRHR
jgi:hypothetical protein